MLQVGSTPDESTSSDYDVIARDLRQLADEAAAQDPPIRMYVHDIGKWIGLLIKMLLVLMNYGLGVRMCEPPSS